MTAYKLLVEGHVQGVGFRYSTQKEAKKYGIKGTVQNLPNGNVLIVAQSGNQEKLNLFVKWCYRGPANARVFRVDISEIPTSESLSSFSIEY